MQLDSNDTTLASCIHVEIVHLSILYKQDFSQNTVPLKNYHFTVNLGNYKKTDTCHSGHKMLTLECVVNMSSVIESSHLQCGTIMHWSHWLLMFQTKDIDLFLCDDSTGDFCFSLVNQVSLENTDLGQFLWLSPYRVGFGWKSLVSASSLCPLVSILFLEHNWKKHSIFFNQNWHKSCALCCLQIYGLFIFLGSHGNVSDLVSKGRGGQATTHTHAYACMSSYDWNILMYDIKPHFSLHLFGIFTPMLT